VNPKDYRRQVEEALKASSNVARRDVRASPGLQAGPDWARDLDELMDTARNAREREDALWRLQAGTFLVAQFAQYRPRYIQALQLAATDADQTLRHAAFDVLANNKDDFARRKLTEGLQDPEKALVSPAVALGLLARDDHGAATSLARSFLSADSDPATRAQAVRVLSADPASTSLLAERMGDKNEFREVRRASAVALRSLDPDRFRALAQNILADHNDFQEIKATVRGALERDAATPLATPAPT
jgi:HEAT repeat protein